MIEQRDPERSSPSVRRAYTLALLTCVYVVYLLDRNAILVTQELFKAEFELSDTQVGLTVGLVYGVAYGLGGLPIGRLIDRSNRTRLLAGLVAVWSGVTLTCGLATQFWHLAAARLLVGAAESGGAPTSLSLLSDHYPAERRASVSSIFFAGAGLGGIISFMAGGYIAAHWGWRAVFLIYGLPGLVLAGLVAFTLREPKRTGNTDIARVQRFWPLLGTLLRDKALGPIYLGSVMFTLSMSGIVSWLVPYFMRIHHADIARAGLIVALAFGVMSTLGSVAFGFAADMCERRKCGGMLVLLCVATVFNGLVGVALACAPTLGQAVAASSLWGLTALVYSGTANAAISRLAPTGGQGMAFALFAVLSNLIGVGLGPLLAGMLSDHLSANFGSASIRPALVVLALVQLGAAAAFFGAVRPWRMHQGQASVRQPAASKVG